MNKDAMTMILVLLGATTLIGAACLGAYLTKKGVNVKSIEYETDKVIAYSSSAAEALAPYLPMPYRGLIQTIAKYSAETVQTTEALYDASMLTGDKRKEAAVSIIIKDMEEANLTVDENVKKLISVAIDAACLVLPHHINSAK